MLYVFTDLLQFHKMEYILTCLTSFVQHNVFEIYCVTLRSSLFPLLTE